MYNDQEINSYIPLNDPGINSTVSVQVTRYPRESTRTQPFNHHVRKSPPDASLACARTCQYIVENENTLVCINKKTTKSVVNQTYFLKFDCYFEKICGIASWDGFLFYLGYHRTRLTIIIIVT